MLFFLDLMVKVRQTAADRHRMKLASMLKGEKSTIESDSDVGGRAEFSDLTSGALDTLGNILGVMGSASFPLEDESNDELFPAICTNFARHVENGAAVPSHDIAASADGRREWAQVRRFYSDRRHAEKDFVADRLKGYRGVVDDLITGLRAAGLRGETTESDVMQSMSSLETAVDTGILPQVKETLSQVIEDINKTFEEQRSEYESQLQELNDRMSSLRQDLDEAQEEMKRDSLTEAYNRSGFDTAIVQKVNAYFILRRPVTLLMIDLDDFKNVNDTWGHIAGDNVLRAVGECLARSFIRRNDLIARYGGDEFAVILSDTTAEIAAKIIERFLAQVRELEFPQMQENMHISCSVGYTEIGRDDTAEALIARADRALYLAKAAGRDRSVFVASDNEENSNDD